MYHRKPPFHHFSTTDNPFHGPTTNPTFIPLRRSYQQHPCPPFRTPNSRFNGGHSIPPETPLDHPPGFPYPRFRTKMNHSGLDITDPAEGRRNYERRIEMEKKQRDHFTKEEGQDKTETRRTNPGIRTAKYTIYITNISREVPTEEITRCCSIFGTVEIFSRSTIWKNMEVTYALVKFRSKEQAEKAYARIGGTRRRGRTWRVSWARRDLETQNPVSQQLIEEGEFPEIIVGIENKEVCKLLCKSWMLVSARKSSISDFKDRLMAVGVEATSLIRWGMYGVIAVCKSEENMEEWEKKADELQKAFTVAKRLEVEQKINNRYCWIECSGIPVQAWSFETMENVASKWGRLLALGKRTDLMCRADVAQIFIETKEVKYIDKEADLLFRKESVKIWVKEVVVDEEMDYQLSHTSCLRKLIRYPDVQEGEPDVSSEDSKEDVDMGGKETQVVAMLEEVVQPGLVSKDDRVPGGNAIDTGFSVDSSANSEREVGNSDKTEKENTFVPETAPTQGVNEARTPIFRPKEVELNGEDDGNEKSTERKRDRWSNGEEREDVCSCCEKFNKSRKTSNSQHKESGKVDEVIEQVVKPNMDHGNVAGPSKSKANKRASKGLAASPFNFGSKGVLGGVMFKPNRGRGRKSRATNKPKPSKVGTCVQPKKSGQLTIKEKRKAFVDTGIQICEEVGVKVSRSSARKLIFSEFMQGLDSGSSKSKGSKGANKEMQQ